MTEQVKKAIQKTSLEDVQSGLELTILCSIFIGSVVALTPII
jgi:hypothetical protein